MLISSTIWMTNKLIKIPKGILSFQMPLFMFQFDVHIKKNTTSKCDVMKVDFNRAALAEALNLVNSIVPARTPKPILRCVHISAAEKNVRITEEFFHADIRVKLNTINRMIR